MLVEIVKVSAYTAQIATKSDGQGMPSAKVTTLSHFYRDPWGTISVRTPHETHSESGSSHALGRTYVGEGRHHVP